MYVTTLEGTWLWDQSSSCCLNIDWRIHRILSSTKKSMSYVNHVKYKNQEWCLVEEEINMCTNIIAYLLCIVGNQRSSHEEKARVKGGFSQSLLDGTSTWNLLMFDTSVFKISATCPQSKCNRDCWQVSMPVLWPLISMEVQKFSYLATCFMQ